MVETPAGLTGEFYATTGLSVSDDGVVSPLDAGLAARNALLQMMMR